MFSVLSSHFLPQEQCNSLILWKLQFPFETSWTYLKSLLFFFHMQYFKKNNAVWWQQIPFHTLLTFILILIFVKYYTPCPSRKAGCPSSSLWSQPNIFHPKTNPPNILVKVVEVGWQTFFECFVFYPVASISLGCWHILDQYILGICFLNSQNLLTWKFKFVLSVSVMTCSIKGPFLPCFTLLLVAEGLLPLERWSVELTENCLKYVAVSQLCCLPPP